MTCGTCTHYDRTRETSYGMAPCAKEQGAYRVARVFSPFARCNKGQHQPIQPSLKGAPA